MKFTAMFDGMPARKEYNPLGKYLEEFMRMNVKVARVDLDEHEYASPKAAANTIGNSIRRRGLPINVHMRNNEVYLVRRDI